MSPRAKPAKKSRSQSNLPKVLILAAVVLGVAIILLAKSQIPATPAIQSLPPEEQVDAYLEDGRPVFIFFHSNNCQACLDMMLVVDRVYPEFKDKVPLVDVNVYDSQNSNLLQRAQIYTIPTQMFVDASGQGRVVIGVMTHDQLRAQLRILAGEDIGN